MVLDVKVAVRIYKPVFVFVFCDPRVHLHFSPFRSTLMQSLLNVVDRNAIEDLFSHLAKWAPLGTSTTLFRNKRFVLNEMFQRNASKFAIIYV